MQIPQETSGADLFLLDLVQKLNNQDITEAAVQEQKNAFMQKAQAFFPSVSSCT